MVAGAGDEFGDFESGVTAQWWGAVRAVVVGGIGSMMVTGLWSAFFPALRSVDQLSEDALLPTQEQEASADPIH